MLIERINNSNVDHTTQDISKARKGSLLYTKGKRITNIGKIFKVRKKTPKQVEAELVGIWFPIIEGTKFGTINLSADEDSFKFNVEHFNVQIGTVVKFHKEKGHEVGNDGNILVKIINKKAIEKLENPLK